MRCVWQSIRPGSTVAPPRSITRAPAGAAFTTSSAGPIARMRSPSIETATLLRYVPERTSSSRPTRTTTFRAGTSLAAVCAGAVAVAASTTTMAMMPRCHRRTTMVPPVVANCASRTRARSAAVPAFLEHDVAGRKGDSQQRPARVVVLEPQRVARGRGRRGVEKLVLTARVGLDVARLGRVEGEVGLRAAHRAELVPASGAKAVAAEIGRGEVPDVPVAPVGGEDEGDADRAVAVRHAAVGPA